jgi:hypothetical protein
MPINLCGLQAAESNRAGLRYIKEDNDCWGVTPETGTTREMRITSSSLTANKETIVSNEIRADRMVSDVVEVAASSGGEINVEFSAGSLDDFLEAFLLGTWTRPMTFDSFEGTNVSWLDNNTIRISSDFDLRPYFTVGRRIKTEGFLVATNNGYHQVASLAYSAPNTDVTIVGTHGVVEAGSALSKVMDANDVVVLRSGAIRAGTAGAQTFDSNSGSAFSSAISAGQLKAGQKIYVDGLGYEHGTYTLTGNPADEDTVTIFDGDKTIVFEFDDDDQFTRGRVPVTIGASAAATAKNLHEAIMTTLWQKKFQVRSDWAFATGTVTFSSNADEADTLTIDPGAGTPVVFEFDNNASVGGGNTAVTIGGSAAATAANLAAAINAANLNVWASVATNVVTVYSRETGAGITKSDVDDDYVVVDFTGDPVVHVYNIRAEQGGSLAESSSGITAGAFSGGVATAHGFYTLTGVAADTLTVAEPVGTVANAGFLPVTVKGSHLRNPGVLSEIIAQSFTIETGFNDVEQYFAQTGMRVGTFGLSFTTGEIVTGTLAFEGKSTTTSNATVLGTAPYDALSTTATPVLNATTNVGDVYKNGELLSVALQSLELNGEASLRQQMAIGSKFPAGIGTGRFNLTGTMTAYFETLELYEDFINHNTLGLAFDFLDGDFNAYWFTIPALKITSDPISPNGIDQDVLEEMEFVALRDANLGTQFMVDRFSSILPV